MEEVSTNQGYNFFSLTVGVIVSLAGFHSQFVCRSMRRELSLGVKIGSYFSHPDGGPKAYSRRKTLSPIVVDATNYGLMQLINHIAEHFMWGSKQYISLFRASDDCDEVCVAIKSDEQLCEWFNLNLENGVVQIDAQINNKYDYHMMKIQEKSHDALHWLDDNHPYIWSRSKFSEECKVDYINNNFSESFNSWV
jgi:hypothetical protein